MSMEYIRKTYDVPAKRGVKIKYTGGIKPIFGKIVGSTHAYIRVKMEETQKIIKFHPTWKIEYLI